MSPLSKPLTHEHYALHWFRRDLRIHGNPALQRAHTRCDGRVLGVFAFDKKFLARPDFSKVRFQFFLETLEALRTELRAAGSDLLVFDESPDTAFAQLLAQLPTRPALVTWNRDYEPFATERDQRMARYFAQQDIATESCRDHLLFEPEEIGKDDGTGYSVFTPFSRRWLAGFATDEGFQRIQRQTKGIAFQDEQSLSNTLFSLPAHGLEKSEDLLATYRKRNGAGLAISLPPAGSRAARDTLRSFRERISGYATARDIPSVNGTSHLSIYLKNGSITVPQIIGFLGLEPEEGAKKTDRGRFLIELAWREFYYHVLARNPHVEHEAYQEKRRNLLWQNDESLFRAWCEGRTGYPIVDAGMRQLNETGWMHNRVRMIVASFLTKDLLVDYRWGERYFMERLLDGDLAPNNGGWQWGASTGCDPQPYFRVFNPQLQGEKFDAEGKYVHRWVPELRAVPGKKVHAPGPVAGYPPPIVDHGARRLAAIAMFRT